MRTNPDCRVPDNFELFRGELSAVMSEPKRGVDPGINTSAEVLADKLQPRADRVKNEATWNMKRLPQGLGKGERPD